MKRPRSLRRLLAVGATMFAVIATAITVGIVFLFIALRRDFERDTRARLVEQHAADEIVTSVYGQLLASYRQLQAPSERNMERFNLLGATAYARIRMYLFQEMPLEARLQVERIKELHQTLEVEAHHAFDLARRGETVAARARVAELELRAARLQSEVDRFVALREGERNQLYENQVALLQNLLFAITLVVAALILCAIVFIGVIRQRVVVPLGQLSAGAVRLGAGDLSARIPEQRYGELWTVAQSFNEMANRIQSARAETEAQNAELSAAIQRLTATQQELVQQEKLGALGLMLAGLAHELNNPLAGILGTAQCLQTELTEHPDPTVKALVGELVTPLITESRRAGDLVRNLLRFSRKSNTRVEPLQLRSAIGVAAGLRAYAFAQAEKALQIDIPDTCFVVAEAQGLEHAAMNIMTNALDAMRSGGGNRLVVSAARTDAEWIALTFEDDGPGFVEPNRIFDPFYTTKPVGTGTGLGLTLVHRFVAEAGGTISAENVVPGGARLTIRLRAAVAPAQAEPVIEHAPSPAPASAEQADSAQYTVLVVDDEPALREIQRRMLTRVGIAVLVAKDGSEAIRLLEREYVDAVVTDVRMPGEIDGLALYEWILREQPWLTDHCLFVTGDIGDAADSSVFGAHPDRLLTKPFHRDEYIARVQSLLASEIHAG